MRSKMSLTNLENGLLSVIRPSANGGKVLKSPGRATQNISVCGKLTRLCQI